MSIFLTDPLIDSLRPKPPEEPDVPDYGGQDYPSFPQAQVQQAPQLGTYTPQAAPSTYDYTPQPQPSFYQPGGAVGDVFSGLGSFAKRQLEMQGQQQVDENQRAMAQGQAVIDRYSQAKFEPARWAENILGVKPGEIDWNQKIPNKFAPITPQKFFEFQAAQANAETQAQINAPGAAFRLLTTSPISGPAELEMATTPITYVGGVANAGRAIVGAGIGELGKYGVEQAGGTEGQQQAAELIGNVLPFGKDIYGLGKGVGSLGKRGLGILDRALGDAPAGYLDPSRRGMLRAEIIPGVGPSDVPPVGLSGAARAANAVASQGAAGGGGAPGNIGAAVARAPEVQKAIDDAAEAVRQDRPGMLGRLLAEFPILTRSSGSSRLGDDVLTADVSRNMVRSYLEQLIGFGKGMLKNGAEFTLHGMPEARLISGIDDAFGRNASRGAKVDAPFIGTRAESNALVGGVDTEYSALNTFKDIGERPQLYNLTPEQKAIIAAGEARNEASRVFVNTNYAKPGEELITKFPVAPGGMHLPTIDKSEAQQAIDLYAKGSNSTQQAVKSAAEKQREFATGWDRFVGEAGQTNLPITDSLYLNPKNIAIPETNIQQLVRGMDNAKIGSASAQTFREALGGKSNIFTGTPAEQARQVRTLRGNGYELVEHGVDLWFPREKAAQIENILKTFDDTGRFNQFAAIIKSNNSQVLSGDLSPIVGVQGQLSMILSPLDTAKAIFQAAIKVGKTGDLFNAFRAETMAELAVKNPRYADYAGALGVSFRAGVPDELVGYTRFLNKFKIGDKYRQINEGMYNFVIKSQFELMDDLVTSSLKRNVPYREALAAAADTATSVYPTGTRALTGLSQEQTFLNSLLFTSLNFIKKPFALTVKGVSGIAKAPFGQASERERNAAKTLVKMWGTVLTISAISQMRDAYSRGDDIDQAALDAVNPFSTNFARMKLSGTKYSIPLGGPLRAIVVTASGVISPRQGDSYLSSPTRYLTGRISPTIKTGKELVLNSDFYGNPIWRADDSAEVAVAKGLIHVGMGALPLVGSQPYQSIYRQEKGAAETAVDLVSAVGGVSVSEMSNTAKLNELSRKMGEGNDFYKLERSKQDKVKDSPEGKLIAEDQREANLRGSETRAQRQKLTDDANAEVQTAVEIYRKAPADTASKIDAAKALRALLSKVQAESAAQRDVMLSDFKPAPNPITDSYYAALKAGNVPGVAKTDRTPVDEWMATQGKNPVEGGKPGDTWADYVDRNTGLSFNNIPEIKELHEAQKAIAKSGWWDLSDKAAKLMNRRPGYQDVQNAEQLFNRIRDEAIRKFPNQVNRQIYFVQDLTSDYNDDISDVRFKFLKTTEGAKIAPLLKKWGYSESSAVLQATR